MDKILFYINDWDTFKLVRPYLDKLEQAGYEVAFDTTNISMVASLAVDKRLVVRHTCYNSDITVSNVKLKGRDNIISINDFLEVAK